MKFVKRLTEPNHTDKYWLHTSRGGLNSCILVNEENGSCLHNCVGYAWGRFYENIDSKPKLSRANAEKWYNYSDGYKRGQEPKLGAIACWEGEGSLAGHVAVVEEIAEDGTITTSNDGYGTKKFWIARYKYPYNVGSKYKFQGFIYPPVEFEAEEPTVVDPFPGVSDEELAARVWAGEFGNGEDRKNALGSRYNAVQALVDQGVGKPTEPEKPKEPEKPTTNVISEGDTVIVNGYGTASSDGTGAKTKTFVNQKMKVIGIAANTKKANRYALNQYNKGTVHDWSAVTGWFNESSLTKE